MKNRLIEEYRQRIEDKIEINEWDALENASITITILLYIGMVISFFASFGNDWVQQITWVLLVLAGLSTGISAWISGYTTNLRRLYRDIEELEEKIIALEDSEDTI